MYQNLRTNGCSHALLAASFWALVAFEPALANTKQLVQGNTAFAFDLHRQLKDTPGNLFFSPYSISTCLAMTFAGARGETEKQMARVLHFDADQQLVHRHFGELQHQLTEAGKQEGIQLNIANALWAQKSHPFRSS